MGESVYEGLADIPIDPFAPGLNVFVGASKEILSEWRQRALTVLGTLERNDESQKDFYARRAADFKALKIRAGETEKAKTTSDATELRQEALNALEQGNLTQLDTLVQQLMQKPEAKDEKETVKEVKTAEAVELGEDLLYPFSTETLRAARELGLAPARTQSRRQYAYLLPHGWQPSFRTDAVREWSKEQLTKLSFPTGMDHAREAIEFYLLNPFINSGGTRYQVCMVVEDLLIEDFSEPDPQVPKEKTKLLTALGLMTRWGLSRLEIETALLQNGPAIIAEELQLDPEAFRLVAIPADIYTHLGAERGWGQKELWTHFDGYRVLEGGKLQPLAGGDIRFGGAHDIVSFSRGYASDKILARFAVVQRKRMMSWHQR
jgi:hypothetical protein